MAMQYLVACASIGNQNGVFFLVRVGGGVPVVNVDKPEES